MTYIDGFVAAVPRANKKQPTSTMSVRRCPAIQSSVSVHKPKKLASGDPKMGLRAKVGVYFEVQRGQMCHKADNLDSKISLARKAPSASYSKRISR